MSGRDGSSGAVCFLAAVSSGVSGSIAWYAWNHDVSPVAFWVAAGICVLSLTVTFVTIGTFGRFFLEMLAAILDALD